MNHVEGACSVTVVSIRPPGCCHAGERPWSGSTAGACRTDTAPFSIQRLTSRSSVRPVWVELFDQGARASPAAPWDHRRRSVRTTSPSRSSILQTTTTGRSSEWSCARSPPGRDKHPPQPEGTLPVSGLEFALRCAGCTTDHVGVLFR